MKHWIIRYRILILVISFGVTLAAALLLPRIKVNPNLDSYVPDKISNKVHLIELDSIFGGSEVIMVMIKADDVVKPQALKRLSELVDAFRSLDGIRTCVSPLDAQNIKMENGFMVMEPLIEDIPENEQQCQALKLLIENNKMANRFFADDFKIASIILMRESDYSDKLLIDNIQKTIAEHPGPEEVLLGGFPYIRYSISGYINKDLIYLLPMALLLMVIMLYTSFHEWKGVLIPFIIVIMSMVISFGAMALLGWEMSLITILLPIMLIAIANDYGIHMIAEYQELMREHPKISMLEVCKRIYQNLKRPIVLTGLTTIGGILGLLTHTMIPAAQLGILSAIGITFSLALSIWFLPALLSFMKPIRPKGTQHKEKKNIADRFLHQFGIWVTKYPKRVIATSGVLGLIAIVGVFFIQVDTNIESYFLGKSDVSKSIKLVNEEFGGSLYISILFHGDVLAPDLLKRMEAYEEELKTDPIVGSISSPETLLKELSKGFYSKDEAGYNRIPQSGEEAYQFLEVFTMGGNEEAVEQFIDYNFENARMLISLNDGSNKQGKRILKKLKNMTANDPNVKFIAGGGFTAIELADMVVEGQVRSLVLALVVVFLLLGLIFKSGRAGVISVLPLSLAILFLFGLMGILGISLDIATALLSSIMIGVGIDYTIHFLWRFKRERANGLNHPDAIIKTLDTSGRGIIFNALSVVIGFLALTFSNFAPLRFFGALVVLSITTCLMSALLLVPSIVLLVQPKFLDEKKKIIKQAIQKFSKKRR